MLYERETKMNINYDTIKAQKNEMIQRFLQAKKQAEQSGKIIAKPLS